MENAHTRSDDHYFMYLQHCMRDYAVLGVAQMWNWFEDKLVRS
jgi:hypothetical protein